MTADPWQGQSQKPEDGEPCATVPVRLRRLNRGLVDSLREELADLYAEFHATAAGDAHRRPGQQNFLDRLTADMHRPGFALMIAETDRLTGCAFGFPVRADGSWWLGFEGVLPRDVGQLTVSGNVFAFADIMIRPHSQDRGLARLLQKRLLSDRRASLGSTLVDRADRQALVALRSWGWLDIGELRRSLGTTTFRALVFPLGEHTTPRPEGLVTMPGGGGPGGP